MMSENDIETRLEKAVNRLLQSQADIFTFTSQTNQTEWNLAHHLAIEIHKEFPELNCDVDLIKPNLDRKRPDIVLHKRGSHSSNLLVIEVKRDKADMEADLEKIREYWFGSELKYQFGASLVLNEKGWALKIICNPKLNR